MIEYDVAPTPLSPLRSIANVRRRSANIAVAVTAGNSRHFRIDRSRLADAADRVAAITRRRYPDLRVPYHSRWRHFSAGGLDRKAELDAALAGEDVAEVARARIDLTFVSVLLDAGAGAAWGFGEAATDRRYTRSEGLAVATFRAFMNGAFSARRDEPLRVDAFALSQMTREDLAGWLQVDASNPLVGLDTRVVMLRRLSAILRGRGDLFAGTARPGGLYDALTAKGTRKRVSIAAMMDLLVEGISPVWSENEGLTAVALGDVWRHPHAGGRGRNLGWVPFHKLTQWLGYSLMEPLEWAGLALSRRDVLTGLPEYRNGGLLLDSGVLALRDAAEREPAWPVGSELVVEWRALTVALLDELAPLVRERLGQPDLPLASILEGGTWAAGRELAAELRGGEPPFRIQGGGTYF